MIFVQIKALNGHAKKLKEIFTCAVKEDNTGNM